jgi:hypothetical protein
MKHPEIIAMLDKYVGKSVRVISNRSGAEAYCYNGLFFEVNGILTKSSNSPGDSYWVWVNVIFDKTEVLNIQHGKTNAYIGFVARSVVDMWEAGRQPPENFPDLTIEVKKTGIPFFS